MTERIPPLAVRVGLALDNLSTAMLVMLIRAAWAWSTDGLLVTVPLVGASCGILGGGYAAGRSAGYRETLHGTRVGFGDVVVGVGGFHFGTPAPAWCKAVSSLCVVPAATLGGHRSER